MPKIYNDKNVYEAAMERFDIIFTEFNDYYFSVSGGKDSSIMLQLAAQAARKHQKKFSVLFIDLELPSVNSFIRLELSRTNSLSMS